MRHPFEWSARHLRNADRVSRSRLGSSYGAGSHLRRPLSPLLDLRCPSLSGRHHPGFLHGVGEIDSIATYLFSGNVNLNHGQHRSFLDIRVPLAH